MGAPWLAIALVALLSPLAAAAQSEQGEALPAVAVPPAHEALKPAAREAPEASEAKPRSGGKDAAKPTRPARDKRGSTVRRRPVRKKSPYDLMRESWHSAAPADMCEAFRKAQVPDLVFQIQGKDTSYILRPSSRQGGFDETQLAIAKEAFGSWEGGPTPHPRTLDLIYAATLHFEVPYVHLISGIRKDRGGSRHSHGLAADVVFPGVDDEELAAYFRAQGFVGVGTYPRSGFVHVDTRDKSYFWIDGSSPNKRGRIQQVRAAEARAVDEAALARGTGGFVNPPRLQKALNARAVRRRRVQTMREAKQAASSASAPASSSSQTPP